MSEHAITVGQFAGYTSLATGDVRFKIDIPREHISDALRIFGDAIGAQVSVARLTESAGAMTDAAEDESRPSSQVPAEPGGKPGAHIPTTAPGRPRTPWHELTRSQQAGIRCGEDRFTDFLICQHNIALEDDPAEFVRAHCDVTTRANLDTDSIAAATWDALDLEYRTWAGLEAEPR